MQENVIIMGAAGRDFHNFNVYFRDNKRYNVVCFTATQILDIDGRRYPPELAGSIYPNGIPIESDDPRPYLVGTLKGTFESYPEIGKLLPAMGYGEQQVKDLEATINACDCDVVVSATPIDLTRLVDIKKPTIRVNYSYRDNSKPTLGELVKEMLETR